jgi:hypothetical protein
MAGSKETPQPLPPPSYLSTISISEMEMAAWMASWAAWPAVQGWVNQSVSQSVSQSVRRCGVWAGWGWFEQQSHNGALDLILACREM